MEKFIVTFSGGGEGGYYEYTYPVESKDKDVLEFYLLECKGTINIKNESCLFEDYSIHLLEDWITKNTITI